MADHSDNTISEAIRIWTTKVYIPAFQFDTIQMEARSLTTSSSSGQEFLNGCYFTPDDGQTWLSGHMSLSPDDSGLGYVKSCHLTLVGGSSWRGNYFFSVSEGVTTPSDAPNKFKGDHSFNGNKLPETLRSEVIILFDRVLNEPA